MIGEQDNKMLAFVMGDLDRKETRVPKHHHHFLLLSDDDEEAGPPGDDDDDDEDDEDEEEDGSEGDEDEVGLSYLMKDGIQVSWVSWPNPVGLVLL